MRLRLISFETWRWCLAHNPLRLLAVILPYDDKKRFNTSVFL